MTVIMLHGQTFVTPSISANYSKFSWDESGEVFDLNSDIGLHISMGLGIVHRLGEFYSLNIHNSLFKGRYQARGLGFNPVECVSHGTLDSDISMSRKINNSIAGGIGFKHLLFYNATVKRAAGGEKYSNVNGLGYNVHFKYELNNLGIWITYNRLYNYQVVNIPRISYNSSATFDLRVYYKFSIFQEKH